MKKFRALAVLFGLSLSSSSYATLIGDTVECSSTLNGIDCSAATAVVGVGQEFSIDAPAPGLLIDIGASTVQLTGSVGTNWFAGDMFTLSDLDWTDFPSGFITNVILSGVSGITGSFVQSDISFTPHSLTVDLGLTSWNSSSTATLIIEADHGKVPVPATLALLGLGLAGMGWSRRQRKKA